MKRSSSSPQVTVNLERPAFMEPSEPPRPPAIRYYYSDVEARNVSYIYRVVQEQSTSDKLVCYPEARGWPRLTLASRGELEKNFKLLEDHEIVASTKGASTAAPAGQVRFPDLQELRLQWQVGCDVSFRHCEVRTSGKVVGRFVWRARSSSKQQQLRLVLLLQLPTNELVLSSQVTDLQEAADQSVNKEEVYIQGISLISVVATLIANVAYLASLSPIRGIDESRQGVAVASNLPVPTVFLFFNAFAFYAAVLAVVLMTAFIPIYGTAGEWGAIFLSGSVPVVLSLVAFYVAYMVSAWAVLDSWGTSLGITVVGILMVVYVRFWAIELMHGNVDRNLEMAARSTPWDWYHSRLVGDHQEKGDVDVELLQNDVPGVQAWFSPAERVARVRAKVRQLVTSPTLWQLSVLGTVPESQNARTKSKILMEHQANYSS